MRSFDDGYGTLSLALQTPMVNSTTRQRHSWHHEPIRDSALIELVGHHKHASRLTFGAVRWDGPRGPHDAEQRWADARRLLHNDTLTTPCRCPRSSARMPELVCSPELIVTVRELDGAPSGASPTPTFGRLAGGLLMSGRRASTGRAGSVVDQVVVWV